MAERPLVPLGPIEIAVGAASAAGLVILVALGSASNDEGPGGAPLITTYGPALFRAIFILIVIAEALVIALVVWALWPDGEKRGAPRAKRGWLAGTIATLVQMVTALVLLWYLRNHRIGGQLAAPGTTLSGLNNLKVAGPGSPLPSGTEWLTALVVVGVLALVGWRLWRTFGLGARSRREILAERLDAAVEQSIEDLESDADSRRAVITAYGRMNAVLAEGGFPRLAHETALEYLARVLGTLDIHEGPLRRLTDLFQFAKFSPHAVDLAMKDEAVAALREIRATLPGVRRVPRMDGFAGVPR